MLFSLVDTCDNAVRYKFGGMQTKHAMPVSA